MATPSKIAVQVEPSNKHRNVPVLSDVDDGISLKAGYYLVVKLDRDGNEIETPFKVNEKMYNKYFSDPVNYKLKKKA